MGRAVGRGDGEVVGDVEAFEDFEGGFEDGEVGVGSHGDNYEGVSCIA